MTKLVEFTDFCTAPLLVQRLHSAGIDAFADNELRGFIGTHSATVWLRNEWDRPLADEVLRQFLAEAKVSHPRLAADGALLCVSCRYDLRGHAAAGHTGPGRCPECGHPFDSLPFEIRCPHCNVPVPDNFEVCWKCGTDLTRPPESPSASPESAV